MEPLGSANQNWWGGKLLPMSVSTYPVDCVHVSQLLRRSTMPTANLTWLQSSTEEPQLLQYFKMVCLEICTKCVKKDGFCKYSHIYCV